MNDILEIPPAQNISQRPEHFISDNQPQEQIVVPLSVHGDKGLLDEMDILFPAEKQSELVKQITPQVIEESLNKGLAWDRRVSISIPEKDAGDLARRDLSERLQDHTIVNLAIESKITYATYIQSLVAEELNIDTRLQARKSNVDQAVLEVMLDSITEQIQSLKKLAEESKEVTATPFDDLKAIQRVKQSLMFRSHAIAGLSGATERVSPEMANISNFHRGVMQSDLNKRQGFLNERGASVYAREQAGTMGQLLGLNISREYGLPENNSSSRKQVEVYTSGMAALSSILETVENQKESDPEVIVTEGTYFELAETARRHETIKDVTPIGDELYFDLAEKLKRDTPKPLVIFSQPFGSGLEGKTFDLDRTLSIVKASEGKRPVTLIVDSTMHGASLGKWQNTQEITATGKDFTLVEVQSMVKHGQIGMDTVPAGVALAYGSHPEIIREMTGARGAMISEHNASVLFPFSAEWQLHRIQRAGRNAEYIANHLENGLKDNPLINKVHYASNSDPETAQQYQTKPPILFLELNPLIPPNEISVLIGNFTGIHNSYPESGRGTSYGFDGTRFEIIPIGENGAKTLRIAAGQESSITLMALTKRIEGDLNNKRYSEQVSHAIKDEMRQIGSTDFDKDYFKLMLKFDSSLDPNNGADNYIRNLELNQIYEYFNKQCKGHLIINELTNNSALRAKLNISEEEVSQLQSRVDKPEEIKMWIKDWVITQPQFLDRFRKKLSIGNKTMSQERAYQLAKAITDHKAVKLVLGPISKIANSIFKDMQEEIEAEVGGKLPFEF